jgi:hypothetical protein
MLDGEDHLAMIPAGGVLDRRVPFGQVAMPPFSVNANSDRRADFPLFSPPGTGATTSVPIAAAAATFFSLP